MTDAAMYAISFCFCTLIHLVKIWVLQIMILVEVDDFDQTLLEQ